MLNGRGSPNDSGSRPAASASEPSGSPSSSLLRDHDTDDFAASVERDLEQLPTLEDFDRRN